MWKYLSRGIRESFERRLNFSRKDKGTNQECPLTVLQNKLIPGIVSTHTFDKGTDNLGGHHKFEHCHRKKRQNKEHHGEKWKHNVCIEQSTLLGALGWSGVLVLGWYMCQPVCRRRQRAQPPELKRLRGQTRFPRYHTEYVSLFRILSNSAFAQPLSILPKNTVVGVPSSSSSSSSSQSQLQSSATVSVDVTDSPENFSSEQLYGPLTAEEALDEAADNLTKAQNSILSGIENRLGVACMQLNKHKEAFTYFQKAVELDNAPAAFNLGLCYEIGAGTVQDLKLAAKYYELASSMGHATAMYNLGVFHVRGCGGVPVDSCRARELFTAAAALGQTDAQEALSMISSSDDTTDQAEEETIEPEAEVAPSEADHLNILFRMLNVILPAQHVTEVPKPLQNITNLSPKKSNANKITSSGLQTEKINKTIPVEKSDNFGLENELMNCKDVPQLSIAC